MNHIFVDFEITCWGKLDRIMTRKVQEIIDGGTSRENSKEK